MSKGNRAQYTLEFKIEAVRLVRSGQSVAAVSATLGVSDQTLHNWVKADSRGLLKGTAARPVSPEQMEISRLRAELSRVKMERDILKKATVVSTGRSNSFIKRSSWRRVTQGFSWSHVHALRDRVEPLLRHDR